MVRVAPQLARLRADRSVYGAVSRFVKDERLRQALSFHALLIGGNPFETSAIYTLIPFLERKWGVFFPRGGTGALVRGAGRAVRSAWAASCGSATPVERVAAREERGAAAARGDVGARGGSRRAFDVVVSNADLHHTYARLYAGTPAADAAARAARAHGLVDVAVRPLLRDAPHATRASAHHTVLFGPRYREMLREIFHGPELPPDFSLYLHQPTVTDPSLAPPGCETFYVLAPVPHLGAARHRLGQRPPSRTPTASSPAWRRCCPICGARSSSSASFTPLDFRDG